MGRGNDVFGRAARLKTRRSRFPAEGCLRVVPKRYDAHTRTGGGLVQLREFQARIDAIYGARDRPRGPNGTYRRLVEEIGELARAIRHRDPHALEEEVSDVLAWTVSVASLCGVDVETAAARYAAGCPKCHQAPCACLADSG